jgi:hypothetical protein
MVVVSHSMGMTDRMRMRHCVRMILNRMGMCECKSVVVVATMRVTGDVRLGKSKFPSTAVAANCGGTPRGPLRRAVGVIPDRDSTAKVGNAVTCVATVNI